MLTTYYLIYDVHYDVPTCPNWRSVVDLDYDKIDHQRIRAEVRTRLAARLDRLLDDLTPLVDPRDPATLGEVSPAMISAFVAAGRLLGDLYQVREAPEKDAIPASQVEKMLAQARQEAAEAAVEAFRTVRELEAADSAQKARTALVGALAKLDGPASAPEVGQVEG